MEFCKEGIIVNGRLVTHDEMKKRREAQEEHDMAKKGNNESIMRYDEELAKQAEEYANQEANTGGGEFFSIAGGTLKFNGAALPFNQVGAVIVDSILVNSHFPGKYDPNNPQQPDCYSFGRDEKTMKPHAESTDPVCPEGCADCPNNVFGSGEGRGKACKNGRRLALLAAGVYESETKFKPFTDPEEFEKGKVGFLPVPPTSINSFGAYTKQIAGSMKLPPHGVFTKVKVKPLDGGGCEIIFEPISKAPASVIPILVRRNQEVRKTIEFPFPKPDVDSGKKAKGKAAKPAGKKGAPRRSF